ncbi:chemotaxis response regulator protein-glutamate methylesterase [Opitutus sp. ER46]|uniref:protein-glutamate methylesterase/protein-glutamine glutaminase n=1 Tax=Opitutus sp. ER46 TaxID=2161864 RepID=UPI000D2F8012|nr:chemotaxis response regulator protein-glutamate methylesterase [Opitutus sp. ER46]PTX90891.1 chemotaxis response regulator protein-glutamate methylesterase [Opitutus sp. ER46]
MPLPPIRVLVVDDSAMVRKLVTDALKNDPEIEVVGTAIDPYVARDKITQLNPDVITLDIEMPRMDGLTFLKILMEQRPMPVIVMSSVTAQGSQHALDALRLGAFDVLSKPGGPYSFGDLGPQLIERIKATRGARVRRGTVPVADAPLRRSSPRVSTTRDIILLGASTGGTEALRTVLTRLPGGLPGIAIVQHIPPVFSKTFADRLNELCQFEVREAVDGDILRPGLALVAPGNFHMIVQWVHDHYQVRVTGGPPVWHQRPAVDILFKSAADTGAGTHALAGLLTGMGRDGAEGLLKLREKGAVTFAQDEASSVVYGMPRAAWENGGAQRQLAIDRVADFIIRHHESGSRPPFDHAPTP